MSSGVRLGVVGLGSIGLRHAKNLLAMGVDVVAFDPAQDRRDIFVSSGGRVVGDKNDLVPEVDALVIASPSGFHLDDLMWAVGHGKHTFIEKPLAHTLEGMDGVIEEAQFRRLVLALGMNMRFNPAIMALADTLKSGGLGQILWANYWHSSYLPDWRPNVDYRLGYAADPVTGGVIFDVIHGFDLMDHLLGAYRIAGANARSSGTLDVSSDDCADIMCFHEGGITSTLHMDFITRPKTHIYTVAGNKAIARVDISRRSLVITDVGENIIVDRVFNETSVNDDYCDELRDFINATQGRALAGCSVRDGLRVLTRVIESRKIAGLPHAK